jgi:phosphate transport system substrate-binding protein
MKNLVYSAALFLFAASSCGEKNTREDNKLDNPNQLIISGSDTEFPMVKKLSENYRQDNPNMEFDVTGGGTSVGLQKIINKECHIANASREISLSEASKAKASDIDLMPIMFATDAVVIITHSKLGIQNLNIQQVAAIFSGKIKNWNLVGGPNLPITLYGRDSSSGTYGYLKKKFQIDGYCPSLKALKDNNEIVVAVEKDKGGVGYCGLGYILDADGKPKGSIWSMPLSLDSLHAAISPLEVTAVVRGDYPLTRPLYQYIRNNSDKKIKDFILFELSGRGQSVIKQFGYFPINDYQVELNKLNGIILN